MRVNAAKWIFSNLDEVRMATAGNFSVKMDNVSTPESDNLLSNILISDRKNKKDEKEKDLESTSR